MLAAFTHPVKSPASPTLEQAAVDQALNLFWTLVERLRSAADQQRPIHQVEETIFRQLLVMGRSLLQAFVAAAGDGDVGLTLSALGEQPSDPFQVLPRLDEPRSRPYLSIFGEISITRTCYGLRRVEAAPSTRGCTCPDASIPTSCSSGSGPSSSITSMPGRSRSSRRSWDWACRSRRPRTSTASSSATSSRSRETPDSCQFRIGGKKFLCEIQKTLGGPVISISQLERHATPTGPTFHLAQPLPGARP
jgi:hypothetical protein